MTFEWTYISDKALDSNIVTSKEHYLIGNYVKGAHFFMTNTYKSVNNVVEEWLRADVLLLIFKMSHHGSEDNFMTAGGSDSFWEPGNYKRTTKRIEDGNKVIYIKYLNSRYIQSALLRGIMPCQLLMIRIHLVRKEIKKFITF